MRMKRNWAPTLIAPAADVVQVLVVVVVVAAVWGFQLCLTD